MKRSIILTLLFAVASFVFYIKGCVFLDFVELKALDYQFRVRGTIKKHLAPVAIVAIDEKSIKELGRWPWTRNIIATGIEKLFEYGASVVGLDIVFSESENVQQREFIKKLSEKIGSKEIIFALQNIDFDAPLANIVRKYKDKLVLGYFFDFEGTEPRGSDRFIKKSEISVILKTPPQSSMYLLKARGVNTNISAIEKYGKHFGFFNAKGDKDGIYRRAVLIAEYGGSLYPSLPLQMARLYKGENIILYVEEGFATRIRIGDIRIPLMGRGEILLNFPGHKKTFPHYSFVDVLKRRIGPEELKGKIILIGATAVGIYDVRPTPVDETYPGVEIHATAIDNILEGRYLMRPEWLWFFELLALWLIFGIITFTMLRRGAMGSIFISFIPIALLNGGSYIAFRFFNLWIKVVYPTTASILLILILAFYRYFKEERMKRMIRNAFEHYLSEELVEIVVTDPEKLKLGGEKREITILFSDVRDFTTLSEELSAEEVAEFLHGYLTPMTRVILKHKGLLDKYIGDAIMAIFGAPVYIDDHAERACFAALNMLEVLKEFNRTTKWKEVNIGIGINTGKCIVGNMGSDVLFDYTAVGDTVNIASRLEGITKVYKENIIVSESTVEKIKNPSLIFRELDYVKVKGKKKPVRIFQLVGERNKVEETKLRLYEEFSKGLSSYRKGQWDDAIKYFKKCLEIDSLDFPSQLFLQKCNKLKEVKPTDWDGIFEIGIK